MTTALRVKKAPAPANREADVPAIRALAAPSTFDAEQRTVELVWTTGADVIRYDWDRGGYFWERLRVDKKSVDLSRVVGGPLLSSHNMWSLDSVLGVVERAWIEGDEGKALVRFSARDEVRPIAEDVRDGIIRQVSVGYRVSKWQDTDEMKDGIPVRLAIRWQPFEVSLVAVGADPGAGVRAELESDHGPARAQTTRERMEDETQTNPPAPTPAPAPPVNLEAERAAAAAEATRMERERQHEIRSACRSAKLTDGFADELVETGVGIDEARRRIIDKISDREDTEVRNVQPGDNESRAAAFRTAAIAGLTHRCALERTTDRDALAFGSMSLLRLAEECLAVAGQQSRGLGPYDVARRAMATSDFSAIVAQVAARSLRAGYEASPRTFVGVFQQAADIMNFKNVERVKLSDAPELQLVAEGQKYEEGEVDDSKETYALRKYGLILPITWEAIINDDLGAIRRFPQLLGAAAARKESDVVWGRLTGNPLMADGNPLFHVSRNNTVTTAPSAQALEVGRAWFRSRTAPNGDKLNLTPAFLICGGATESAWEKILRENLLQDRDEILAPSLRNLSLVVEPRISSTSWYLAAAPGQVDTIEYGYLAGDSGVTIEESRTFDADDYKVKARLVVGAGAIDSIGLYHSTGAGG